MANGTDGDHLEARSDAQEAQLSKEPAAAEAATLKGTDSSIAALLTIVISLLMLSTSNQSCEHAKCRHTHFFFLF